MHMRRVLSWLVFFCFLFSVLCGAVYGAEWTSIDDMGIDPWGDLEAIQALPVSSPGVYAVGDDVDMDDVAIAPMSLPTGDYSLTVYNPTSTAMEAYPFLVNIRNGYSGELSKGYTALDGASGVDNNYECWLYAFRGTYYDVVSPVTVFGSTMVISGKLSAYPRYILRDGSLERNIAISSSDLECCLLVNGQPVGEYSQGDTLNFSGFELDLSDIGTVTSLGIRVRNANTSAAYVGNGTGGFVRVDSWSFGWYVSDTLLVEGGQQGGVDEETKGLLGTIIGWLTQIKDGITGVAGAIAALPGQIMSALIDGLKSLFIPSQDDFTQLKAQYESLLSERLGFVWQVGEWVVDFGQSVLSAMQGGGDYAFNFPGITVSLPDGTFTIVPAQTVSFDNAAMNVVRPVAGTAVSLVCVLAFLRTAERMLVALISGVSYFHWLKGDDDNAD